MMNELSNTRLYTDVCSIIEQGRREAYACVSQKMVETYWNIGRRIVEEEQCGKERAEYGAQIIAQLAVQLTHQYGKGFSARYLRSFRKFYLIVDDFQIWKSRFPNLTWTHIFKTLRVDDPTAIRWYLEMASREMWSVRTLDRNISTQYFERHFVQPALPMVETEPHQFGYSILKGNEQLFAAKYKTFLPTEEQLRTEIERQKQLFMLQHENKENKEG